MLNPFLKKIHESIANTGGTIARTIAGEQIRQERASAPRELSAAERAEIAAKGEQVGAFDEVVPEEIGLSPDSSTSPSIHPSQFSYGFFLPYLHI